jgi:phage I-like protein
MYGSPGHSPAASLAACLVPASADTLIHLLPAGEFDAPRGALRGSGPWHLDDAAGTALATRLIQRRAELVVDYEHQTLLAASNGQPAPAAGWIDPATLIWRPALGLFGTVRWTERATALLKAGEYRYLSPVFAYDPATGAVLDLLHVALTNTPALEELDAVVLRAAARFSPAGQPAFPAETSSMKKVLAALGLADDATEDQALAALATERETATAALAAAKAPDPAQFAPVATVTALQAEVAALRGALHQRELDDLIEIGLSDGRVVPAMEAWARSLGAKDLAALKDFLAAATPIAALKGTQTGGKGPDDPPAGDEPLEQRCQREFATKAALRAEFGSVDRYLAYAKATAAGLVRTFSKETDA